MAIKKKSAMSGNENQRVSKPVANRRKSSSLEDQRKKTKELIDVTNKDLRYRGHKATLAIHQEGIYIRGTFPTEEGNKRRYIPTGLAISTKSVATAETRVLTLLSAIKTNGRIPDPLPWEAKKIDSKGYPKVKAIDAIAILKDQFFSVETTNPKSRLSTWKTMEYGLNKLDPGAYVTTDYLIAQIIDKSKDPKTGITRANQKLKLKQYFKRLGVVIGLPDINKINEIETPYEPKKRDIPITDPQELLDLAVKLIPHEKYGWLTAAMIIYGCRPSETFSLIPKPGGIASVFTIKKKKGLPTVRTAMALPTDFPEKLNMFEISRPLDFRRPEDFDPIATKKITDTWAEWLNKKVPGLNLYDLRHSWAKKSIREKVPTGLAAKCMGHSISMFEKTYLRTLDEEDVAAYAKKHQN